MFKCNRHTTLAPTNILKMLRNILFSCLLAASAVCTSCHPKILTEYFLNSGPSLDMVSTLIIGSKTAAKIDLPLAVPPAIELAE